MEPHGVTWSDGAMDLRSDILLIAQSRTQFQYGSLTTYIVFANQFFNNPIVILKVKYE